MPLTIIDNNALNALTQVTLTAASSGYSSGSGTIKVHDNETAILSVSLPTSAREGDGAVTGTITASVAPAENVTIQLSSSNSNRATVPATVTLLAGQTTAPFNLSIVDNAVIDDVCRHHRRGRRQLDRRIPTFFDPGQ